MTEQTCKSIDELLVAYSDGELSAVDVGCVEAHLAGCPDCREELRALERSLEIAGTIWRESAARAKVPEINSSRRPRRRSRLVACAAACVVLLLTATAAYVLSSRDNRATSVADTTSPTAVETEEAQENVHEDALEDEDVEAFIARQDRVAQLMASARLLGTQPGLEEYRDRAERYLAEFYGVGVASEHDERRIRDRDSAVQ